MKTQGLKRCESRSMASSACLVVLLVVVCAGSWSRCSAENYDGIHAICSTRCSVFVDPATYEMCMAECRNYVEMALARPRDPLAPQSVFEQLMEKAAAAAGRNAAVTKATGDQSAATERRDMRGAFVRIGRSQNNDIPDAPVKEEDLNKRRSGFVRIGRRRATEEFVRIGKRSPDAAEGPAAEASSSDAEPNSAEMEKRKNPTAFVRIGKAKTGNFVRIGRKQTAFVRIGKNAWNGVDELQDDETKAAGDNDEYERQLRREAFVRIGK